MTDRKKAAKRESGGSDGAFEHKRRPNWRSARDYDLGFLSGFRTAEPLAEELGEAFLESATSGEESEPERHERVLIEEEGGPFVRTRASQEFAYDFDESNIAEATREPLPKTSSSDP